MPTTVMPPAENNSNQGYLAAEERPDWYYKTIPKDIAWPTTRQLLIDYSKFPEAEVDKHVYDIRERAWAVHDYPCIGRFRFLDLSIRTLPNYNEIVERLKAGERMLDLGCCFGQDERKLVSDGAPSDNTYACDLRSSFFPLGYELFRDKDRLSTQFFEADVFDDSNPHLVALYNTVNIINASAFFHLFEYDEQILVCLRIVKLIKKSKGSMVVGRHMGNFKQAGSTQNWKAYRHTEESWKAMWKGIGEKTGTKWECEVEWGSGIEGSAGEKLGGDGTCLMQYACRLVEY